MKVLSTVADSEGKLIPGLLHMWCPGCQCGHAIYTKDYPHKSPKWTFNGDFKKPTFSPSLLVSWNEGAQKQERRCHSFIRNGEWQFLSDCTHDLAGQTVPMVSDD